jgi:hypothetical protein
MISVDMSSLWSDETDLIVQGIAEATKNIASYRRNSSSSKALLELGEDMGVICDFWTGKTYGGSSKSKVIKEAFQGFFTELMQLLLEMKESQNDYEVRVAKAMLYTGKVYRYLGKSLPNKKVVVPVYDDIYVSWSKCPNNDYLLSKLYGPVTWLSCEIVAPQYGIDLGAIGASRANEHEVVFPTIEKCITEIKYISEDNDDET